MFADGREGFQGAKPSDIGLGTYGREDSAVSSVLPVGSSPWNKPSQNGSWIMSQGKPVVSC